MTLRRTTDRLPHKRYGRGRLEFESGEREASADDETEEWAAETFAEIERVPEEGDLEDLEYEELQDRAKAEDIPANQSREELIGALREAAARE